MPTIFTHPVVAIAAKPYLGECARRPAIWVTGAVLTILPDLDVIGFYYGIPYGHVLGHRGLTHSLPFALVVGALVAAVAAYPARLSFTPVWLYFAICLASHGLLDACSDGGSGVAFFAPFSDERYFFPFRPIDVSPIGVDAFFNDRGARVLINELMRIWTPAIVILVFGVWIRSRRRRVS